MVDARLRADCRQQHTLLPLGHHHHGINTSGIKLTEGEINSNDNNNNSSTHIPTRFYSPSGLLILSSYSAGSIICLNYSAPAAAAPSSPFFPVLLATLFRSPPSYRPPHQWHHRPLFFLPPVLCLPWPGLHRYLPGPEVCLSL